MSRRAVILIGAAVAALAVASTLAVAIGTGAFRSRATAPNGECTAPRLPGTVVDVVVTNMGRGFMMNGAAMGGSMRVRVSRASVGAGTVSFRVANTGSLVHELVILPLDSNQGVGQRTVGTDQKIDEAGSLGEVSHNCGASTGDGIDPGSLGWSTLTLPRGSYELVCNLPGHYSAGMYTRLDVR